MGANELGISVRVRLRAQIPATKSPTAFAPIPSPPIQKKKGVRIDVNNFRFGEIQSNEKLTRWIEG